MEKTNTIMDIKQWRRWHNYYYRSGFYGYLIKNTIKIAAILAAIVIVFVLLEKWIIDIEPLIGGLFQNMNQFMVLLLFVGSETVLGLIPPDLFILWTTKFSYPWFWVSLLGVLSYIGGIGAYYLGVWLQTIPKLNYYVTIKFADNIKRVKRWGGFFIVLAALFPIPYSIVCTLSGILKFPIKPFLLLALTRIARFYIYGIVLMGLLS